MALRGVRLNSALTVLCLLAEIVGWSIAAIAVACVLGGFVIILAAVAMLVAFRRRRRQPSHVNTVPEAPVYKVQT